MVSFNQAILLPRSSTSEAPKSRRKAESHNFHSICHKDYIATHNAIMLTPTRLLRAQWTSTLHLPKSAFPARPTPASTALYLKRCTDDLYSWQQSKRYDPNCNANSRPETFVLHDGPPYANGPLHVGHALNKITKDLDRKSVV